MCVPVCMCVCMCMYVYYLTDPDSCLIDDGFFPPNTGSASKPPPLSQTPMQPHSWPCSLAFLSLLTSAIFHFPLRVCVCVCERERERECSGSLPRSKKHLSLTLSSCTCSCSTAHYMSVNQYQIQFFTGKKRDEINDDLKHFSNLRILPAVTVSWTFKINNLISISKHTWFRMHTMCTHVITPVFSVTWFFRNHSNMLICWFKKQLYYAIYLLKPWCRFSKIFWIES